MGVYSTQQLSITIPSGSTTGTGTLSAASGTFFLISQHETTSATTSFAEAFCRVTISGTTVTATRNTSSTNAITVNIVVGDGDSGLISSVQTGTIAIVSDTSARATISAVTAANTAVNLLGFSCGNSTFNYEINHPILSLTSTTSVTSTVARVATNSIAGFCVINYNGSALAQATQYVSKTWTNTSNTVTVTITSAATNATLLIFAGCHNGDTVTDAEDQQRVSQTNATTLTITAGTADSDAGLTTNVWAVTFASGVFSQGVQSGSTALTSLSTNGSSITSSPTAQTTAIYTGYSTTTTATTNLGTILPRLTQTSATLLTVSLNSSGTATLAWNVGTWAQPSSGSALTIDVGGCLELVVQNTTDSLSALETWGQLTSDNGSPVETLLSAFPANTIGRVELLAELLKDSAPRFALSSGSRVDTLALLTLKVTLQTEKVNPVESVALTQWDSLSEAELKLSVSGDTPAELSSQGASLVHVNLPGESTGQAQVEAVLPRDLEVAVSRDKLSLLETTGKFTRDQLLLEELSGTSQLTLHDSLPLDLNVNFQRDQNLLSSSTGNLTADRSALLEALPRASRDTLIGAETLLTLRQDPAAQAEVLLTQQAEMVSSVELLGALSPDNLAVIEVRGTLQVNQNLQFSAVVAVLRGSASALEQLVGGLTDLRFPAEVLATPQVHGSLTTELTVAQVAQVLALLENLLTRSADSLLNLETTNTVEAIQGDTAFPVELLVRTLQDNLSAAECTQVTAHLETLRLELAQVGVPPVDPLRIFTVIDIRNFTVGN